MSVLAFLSGRMLGLVRRRGPFPALRSPAQFMSTRGSNEREEDENDDFDDDEPVSLAGTKTFENLKEAFSRKSMAMARYEFYAQKADVEGLTEAAQAFRSLANSAREQAFGHMEFLDENEDVEEDSSSTEVNVGTCIAQEQNEFEDHYPKWADIAYSENISDVGTWMESLRDTSFRNMSRLQRVQEQMEQVYSLEGLDDEDTKKDSHVNVRKG